MAADTTESLPRYLAPLPRKIETAALRYAWVIVAINLAGTAFGFWYYIPQFRLEPILAWPVVPDSPTATLFIACSLALYKLGRSNKYLNMLAFFGCIKLGLWTPYVLTVFADAFLATVSAPPQVVSTTRTRVRVGRDVRLPVRLAPGYGRSSVPHPSVQ